MAGISIEHKIGHRLTQEELSQLAELRCAVWSATNISVARTTPESWIDKLDDQADHYLARAGDGAIVACGRVSLHTTEDSIPTIDAIRRALPSWRPTPPIAWLNRLVVHPSARGQGLASKLDALREERAREWAAPFIGGTAVPWRKQSLEKRGFKAIGLIGANHHGLSSEDLWLMLKSLGQGG